MGQPIQEHIITYEVFLGLPPEEPEKVRDEPEKVRDEPEKVRDEPEKVGARQQLTVLRPFLDGGPYRLPHDYDADELMRSVHMLRASWSKNPGRIRIQVDRDTNFVTSIHHVLASGLFLELWASWAEPGSMERRWHPGRAPIQPKSGTGPVSGAGIDPSPPWRAALPTHRKAAKGERNATERWRAAGPTALPWSGLRRTVDNALRKMRTAVDDVQILGAALNDVLAVLDKSQPLPDFLRRCAEEMRYLQSCLSWLQNAVAHQRDTAGPSAGETPLQRWIRHAEELLTATANWVDAQQPSAPGRIQ